jgi:ATP-dependent DNA helicase RecQ
MAGAIEALGRPPVLALTATATDDVIEDIGRQLIGQAHRPRMNVINTGIYRPNLHYRVVHATNDDEKLDYTVKVAKAIEGSGIVYTATVKNADLVYERLKEAGIEVARYHGRMSGKDREAAQDDFMSGRCRVMVATNAFGLGIDKSDIRFVLHYQVPGTLEAYYQESGRAGRDAEAAQCILVYDTRDKRVQQFFLGGRYPTQEDVILAFEALTKTGALDEPVAFAALEGAAPNVAGNKLKVALKLLKDAGFVKQDRSFRYRLLNAEVRRSDLRGLADEYGRKSEADREKLERMIFYAQTAFCRWKVLLEYFEGIEDFERCGTCDNCVNPPQVKPPKKVRLPKWARRPPLGPVAQFNEGDRVRVPRYGEGRVASATAEQVEIVFPDGRKRQFLAAYVEAA